MPDCSELGRELVLAWKECDRLRDLLLKAAAEIEKLEDELRSEQDWADQMMEDCE